MNFTPEVIAALAVLRNNAENDFERHRLDVLERDLTSPPKVEIINDKQQSFNGATFWKAKDDHYRGQSYIHRVVWIYFKGEIPEGQHVHHIDKNPANNNIFNLQLLSSSEHTALHNSTTEHKKYICEVCGKAYISNGLPKKHRFCSNMCRQRWYKEHNDGYQEERVCEYCGKKFLTYKNSNVRCCSHSCGGKLASREKPRTKELIEKICPVCGKNFSATSTRKKQVCCSMSCGRKFYWQKRKTKAEQST